MDKNESRNNKRARIEMLKGKQSEKFHEFATLGDYREAMIEAYRKTKRDQMTEMDGREDK